MASDPDEQPDAPALTRLDPEELAGGDPACWLANVCPDCGAFNESAPGTPCWNCGRS
ncbi:MAG: hypothetical protein LCH76_09755 [Actinobacteria bacterium]|nr:hypothetical protein [Actinomycetota bacterium]